MADTITLISIEKIVIDLKAERERINSPHLFKKAQKIIHLSAIDAFEQGNIQGMVDIMQHPNSKALFEYPLWEFLDDVFYRIIQDICLEQKKWKLE